MARHFLMSSATADYENAIWTVMKSSRIRRQSSIRTYTTCLHFKKKKYLGIGIGCDDNPILRRTHFFIDLTYKFSREKSFGESCRKYNMNMVVAKLLISFYKKNKFIWVDYPVRAHFKSSFKYNANICTHIYIGSYTQNENIMHL